MTEVKTGAATHLCLTRLFTRNQSASVPFTITQHHHAIDGRVTIIGGAPRVLSVLESDVWSTESNAAFRSMEAI